jgi:ATP-binding cassette subfamily C protein LapB
LVQKPLRKLSNEGMRESALRNALLVEAVQGIEDIKLLRAEARFESQWNRAHDVSAAIGMKQRFWVNLLMTWTQETSSIIYALVLLVGSYLVMKGDMTTGALVASSILSSRMIAPLGQLSAVFARWQQSVVARQGLDQIMERPVDQPDRQTRVHRASLRGDYTLERVFFQYGEKDHAPALAIPRLVIKAGEKVAIIGRAGAGKSTLLSILAGLLTPQGGHIALDGIDMQMLDPADLRRDMGLLRQDARLFYGTIRENLVMGAPMTDDAAVIQALAMVGALSFVRARPLGLDDVILEGGAGLSGGQRQILLLARTLINGSQIVLLDEPTANLDDVTERQVIEAISKWLGPRTLLVSTHRLSLLALVDRIIVIGEGKVVMDGPKAQVIAELSKGGNVAPRKPEVRVATGR